MRFGSAARLGLALACLSAGTAIASTTPRESSATVAAGDSSALAPREDSSATARPSIARWRLREVAVLASTGRDRGQVTEPDGLAVDPFGRIWVSDAALHRVQRFDAAGAWQAELGALGSGEVQMRRPGAVARFGAAGVAVLDRENRRVLTFDLFDRALGALISFDDPAITTALGRVEPATIAADRGGALVVVDRDGDRLLSFDASGRFLRAVGGPGGAAGSFRGLAAVAVTPRGEWLTAERGSARVQRLDAAGRPLAAWPIPLARGTLGLALAVDDSGRVALADERAGKLWMWSSRGELLFEAAGLARPRALAFAPGGDLVVAESAPARVRRVRPERVDEGAESPEH